MSELLLCHLDLSLNVSTLVVTGSSQDGARSQRQAGSSGEAAEGGSGEGGLMMELKGSREATLRLFRCSRASDPPPDRRPASGGDGAQDPGADVHALLAQPPAAPPAAVPGHQGSLQTGPLPQQERQQHLSVLAGETGTALGPRSARGQRGARGKTRSETRPRPAPASRLQLFAPVFPTSLPFSVLSALTSPPQPALPLSLCCLLLSQPAAVPALLSLILCLVPGQSLRLSFDQYWQQRREGLERDGRQVTASVRPGFTRFADVAVTSMLLLLSPQTQFSIDVVSSQLGGG